MVRVLRGHYGDISDRPLNVRFQAETGPRDATLLESAMCQKGTSVRVIPFPATTVLPLFLSPLLIVQPHRVLLPRGLDLRPGF